MKFKTIHKEQLDALKRVEGQVKGVQRMIQKEEYCIDIVIQLHAAINALYKISEKIFAKHIEGCVSHAFKKGRKSDTDKKIKEIVRVIELLHKLG